MTTARNEISLKRLVRENHRASAKDLPKMWGAIINKTVTEKTTIRRLNSLGTMEERQVISLTSAPKIRKSE